MSKANVVSHADVSARLPAKIAVTAASSDPRAGALAASLAQSLNLPQTDTGDEAFELLLVVCSEGLELRITGAGSPGPIVVDFTGPAVDYRRRRGGGRRQLIARAVGVRGSATTVLDATAGLGRDAFVLASVGCSVIAVERSPVLGAMLQDGLSRAAEASSPAVRDAASRITLIVDDARDVLDKLGDGLAPDVVYLDPMYPPKKKQSARVKKEMRICRALVGDDGDAGELLDAARRVARKRIVVKRMLAAPPLLPEPAIQYRSRKTRYDVYRPSPPGQGPSQG